MGTRGWITPVAAGAAALFAAGSLAQPAPARATRETPQEPVVVELFTAQGCAGCPAANEQLEAIAAEPGVIALTYAVDYWDWQGWRDTFAKPEFGERQRAYARPLRQRAVATPQVVIDGSRALPGAREGALQTAIDEEAERRVFPPEIEFRADGGRVGVGSGRAPEGGAEVVAVVFTPGPQTVRIRSGDNRGRTVRHMNVVRAVRSLGDWTGQPGLYALPAAELLEGQAVAVLVQAKRDRRILNGAVSKAE